MTSYAKDIEEIRKNVNDLHVSVAEIKTEIAWIKWLVCLLMVGLLLSPLITHFWRALGV